MSKKKVSFFKGKVASDAKRQATAGSSYGYLRLPKGLNVYSPEPGKRAKFDIIPYTVTNPKHPDRNVEEGFAIPGSIWYKRPFRIHRNIGVDKDSVVCLTSFGKKCPICEYRAIQQKAGATKEELKVLNSSLRNLYCVIPIDSKTNESEPHVLDISQFLFQDKLNEEIKENDEYEIYMDLEEGLTLNVRFLSSTMGSSKPFAEAGRIDFEKRKQQYTEDILEEVPDLDSLLTELSYKELETKFMEMEGEAELTEEEEEEEDDVPVRKKKVVEPEKLKRKPSVVKDEDEDDEEDDEPAPVRKRKPAPEPVKKKRPVVVEDDDDDDEPEEEDEDEEDEEEEPVRKKSQGRPAPTVGKDKRPVKLDPILCIACQGTGKNSRGKKCPICNGTGIKPDPDNYMEDEDDDE
jgi:hypothetical protein